MSRRTVEAISDFRVNHPLWPEGMPVYPGDVLVEQDDGTWNKVTGLGTTGHVVLPWAVEGLCVPFEGRVALAHWGAP